MKGLLKILGIGLLVFILLAIVEEWRFFSQSWFGSPSPPVEVSEDDRREAGEAVYLMLTLMRHLYVSDGDSRFAERMPVSDGILEDMLADIEYLAHNHRRQDPQLKSLEVTSVEPLEQDRLEVHTRELWQVRFPWMGRPGEYDEPRIGVSFWRYLVVRGQRGWRVEGWSRDEPGEGAEAVAP